MLSESQNACRVDTNWCRSGRVGHADFLLCKRGTVHGSFCYLWQGVVTRALQSRELKGIEQLVILFGEHHFQVPSENEIPNSWVIST